MRIFLGRWIPSLNVMLLVLAASACAQAQSLADSPIILRSGAWNVHRVTDAMTDATACTGVFKNQYDIQLGENTLTIAVADGVKNVQLRFDDEDPKPSRSASKSERKNGAIAISGSDFAELLDSARLRYEIQTPLNTTVSGDIDLKGVFEAHGNIVAGCAGNPIAPPRQAGATGTCTQPMRDRMSQKGLSVQDIDDICANSP